MLSKNPVLNKRILQNLNNTPTVPVEVCGGQHAEGTGLLDASTCVVSIDYLIHPLEVLSSLRERTRIGGTVHLAVSNRCFPSKAVSRWLESTEEQRLAMVGDYLWFSGWKDVEIIDVKAGYQQCANAPDQGQSGLQGFMSMMGMTHEDPLWVVRARRTE
ncbi:hypothetical protein AAFC00_004703 [Neodothiora populina]|uniref:Methyltransferase type 11 domain-containing protein n=1 Tax=Neodothiora populina TaxID=2781224 RepID=A0ABR3P368_9PEZI